MLEAARSVYGAQGLWLETWKSNGGAVHIYHKLGFIDVTEKQDTRPSAAGGTVDDTRVYMRLAGARLESYASHYANWNRYKIQG